VATSTTKSRGGKDLARRRKALERVAARVADARRAAEEAEAERLRREDALDQLAADFELAREDEEVIVAEVEDEVRRVRERGAVRIQVARVAAARVVVAMGEAGETVPGCGQRLGVGVERVKELRRLARETADAGAGAAEAAAGRAGKDGPGRREDPGGGVAEAGEASSGEGTQAWPAGYRHAGGGAGVRPAG